jgi:phospholipid/cholesterol/gamma-HCH transport system substrate-binding protein
MMAPRRLLSICAAGVVVVLAVTVYLVWPSSRPYTLQLVMPSAAGLYDGSQVQINNQAVGKVTDLTTQDDKAIVTISVDAAHAPLHAGTKPTITFFSLLGQDSVQLQPGPAKNPSLASGSTIQTGWSEVTVQDLLNALNPGTRAQLDSLIQELQTTLAGRQDDLNATVQTAGPTVQALGQVLAAIGSDGPALRELVTNLQQTTAVLAGRQSDLSQTVQQLDALTSSVAGQQQQLSAALQQLPSTLRAARGTLDEVPAATGAATPLLNDLAPATAQLTSVARNLSPVLTDLRPAVAELEPTLGSAQTLLQYTPALLNSAHGVFPGVTQALTSLGPALSFLLPYTPDLVGWADNWGNSFAKYDEQGHYGAALFYTSASEINNVPVSNLPTMHTDHSPPPNLPATDANGDPMR